MKDNFVGFSLEEFNDIFPFFIVLNQQLKIENYGKGIYKIFPDIAIGNSFFEEWLIVRPSILEKTKEAIEKSIGKLLVFHYKTKKTLHFKGHFKFVESTKKYVFFGSVAINATEQLEENSLSISDFALNDSLVDLLYVIKNNEIVNEELTSLVKDLELKKNKLELFQNIINSTSDAIQVANESGQMLYVNAESSKRLGIPMDEIQNYSVLDFEKSFKGEISLWDAHIEELKTKDFLTLEGSNLNKNTGEYFPVEVTVKYLKLGGEGHAVAVSRDISDRKTTEKNLKKQEEKYRNIITNMNLGLLELDENGKIVMCNTGFEKLSGYTLQEVKGKEAASIFSKGETKELLKSKVQDRKIGTSDSYEVLVKVKNGDLRWWLISGATNFNDDGNVTGSIGIHLDITKQKKLEQDLEEALKKAQLSSKSKESFLANMSHEIRTPLNGILGMIQTLQAEKLNSEQTKYVESAYIASEHLLSIINNILDITKIEAGELDLIIKSFSFNKLVKDVELILKNQVNKDNISFSVELDNVDSIFVGDERRLRQILINIIGNALKFTEKGSVKLLCKGMPAKNGKQKLLIEIKDTGIGIKESAKANLFKKFQQEDAGISRKFGGSGLGLVITKELIELMGGSIELESTKNVGTVVRIKLHLPITEEQSFVEELKDEDISKLKGKNILLVEDNEMNRLVVNHFLSELGVHITETNNGKEALSAIQENEFDIILMDIQMPIMGGMEATTYIREELKLDIPIIALSANAFKSEIDACLAIGFNDYIIKPFGKKVLLNAIHRYCVAPKVEKVIEKTAASLYSLTELENLSMGSKDFMQSMLKLFVDIVPQSIIEIDDAFKEKNIESIKKVAHRIKPSIENMGIVSLKEVIRNLEKYDLHSLDYKSLENLILEMKTTLGLVISHIKETQLNK